MPGYDRFRAVIELGWSWRKAAYIAWASLPKNERQPKTKGELCKLLGVNAGAISVWRSRHPGIDAMIAKSSSMGLLSHVADVDQALVESASNPSYRHKADRELYYLRTKIIVPQSKIGVSIEQEAKKGLMEAASDAELMRLAAEQGLIESGEADDLDFDIPETMYEEGGFDEVIADD